MIDNIKERVSFKHVLEPSAGDGSFIPPLKQYKPDILQPLNLTRKKFIHFFLFA